MKKNFFLININEKILIFILILFSLLINQYYGNKGVFPLDSFSHFDSGFRVLNGEYPFRDYWITAGPFIDYIQAIFFYFIGINWQSYVLHASFVNVLSSLITYFILKNFKLNDYFCFFYSILFSILAYPSSGTPFVDHHSAFFSIIGVYFFILAIKEQKKLFSILFPIFFGFAFLSKQVPSSYIILSVIFVLIIYSIVNKNFFLIKYSFLSSISFIFFIFIFLHIQQVDVYTFLIQYIYYPLTIGTNRLEGSDFTFGALIGHFKFIYFAIIPFVYFNLKKIIFKKNFYNKNDFYFFLILLSLMISLIVHQLLTRNQTFIFFLIPILSAFSHISIKKEKYKNNILIIILIAVCIFSSVKYHFRFNEDRKFHELYNVNFDLSIDAKKIDNKFSGLKWISPYYKNNPLEEIESIKKIKYSLNNDDRNKMIITNYSFFSVILNQKLHSPSRWYLDNGVAHPIKGSKYFENYRSFFIKQIKENDIKVIYVMDVSPQSLTSIISEKCLETSSLDKKTNIHLILECDDLE